MDQKDKVSTRSAFSVHVSFPSNLAQVWNLAPIDTRAALSRIGGPLLAKRRNPLTKRRHRSHAHQARCPRATLASFARSIGRRQPDVQVVKLLRRDLGGVGFGKRIRSSVSNRSQGLTPNYRHTVRGEPVRRFP